MKHRLFLILFIFISQNIVFSQSISSEEQKLYNEIMDYRRMKGLASIPLSGALTLVAQTHVKDLQANKLENNSCNMHSWSSNGTWTSCCYTDDHAKASCMWNKPRELTSYQGNGYEIAHGAYGASVTAESALNGWKGSPGHNAVIINQGIWANSNWNAIGIGISNGYAVVWFGKEIDYSSKPTLKMDTPIIKTDAPKTTCGGTKVINNIEKVNEDELTNLKNKVTQLNSVVSEKEGTINKLNREISTLKNENYQLESARTNLNNSVNTLQQQKNDKESQYNKLSYEYNILSDRRTTVKKSKYNADEFHALTFKIGLNTFYSSIRDGQFGKFDPSFLSFGAESMIGFNFGESYRRNSIGITFRANQANRMLTNSLDSNATQAIQFYDAELTTLIREWLSIGLGANLITSYGSSSYQINPSVSLGLCLGPKNWKIQINQQATMNSDKKISGRASLGLALRL
jgi:hypothetical protein